MRSIRDEVRRDRLVATAALLQETLACANEEIERLLLDGCPPDLSGLHERLVERFDIASASCSTARESTGVVSGITCPRPALGPLAAAPFVHRGEYIGWSVDVAAVVDETMLPFVE